MLKSAIKRFLYKLGLDVRRLHPYGSEAARFKAMLTTHRVNLVFDVGANRGDFGRGLREIGYRGRIVSFEPQHEAWTVLSKTAQRDPLWDIAPRAAIGAEDGDVELHVSVNSYSSSVLQVLDALVKIAPESAYVGRESVPLRRLDTFAGHYVRADSILMIKADVQGFELEVLRGARELLKTASGLHLELSLIPLYQGQCAYDEIIVELKGCGFEMWCISPEMIDPRSGRVLQVNATFFRNLID